MCPEPVEGHALRRLSALGSHLKSDIVLPPVSSGTGGRTRKKGLRYGEHSGHYGGDTPSTGSPRQDHEGRRAAGHLPVLVLPSRRIIFAIFFLVPTIVSFYFSFTRWDLFTSTWIGLDNYEIFFNEQALLIGLRNTLIYATMTSGLKVVFGMLLALLLTSKIIARGYLRSVIFFPVLVSTVGVGLTFTVLMNPKRASSTTRWQSSA